MKILLVDDEPFVLDYLKRLLYRHGYDCDGLLDAGEALDRLDKQAYDLVISDIDMPNGSGLDLLAEIRLLLPDLPVILTTGNRDPEYAKRSRKLGASYLEKPFSGSHLVSIIESNATARRPRASS